MTPAGFRYSCIRTARPAHRRIHWWADHPHGDRRRAHANATPSCFNPCSHGAGVSFSLGCRP